MFNVPARRAPFACLDVYEMSRLFSDLQYDVAPCATGHEKRGELAVGLRRYYPLHERGMG